MLNIALPNGTLEARTMELFANAGIRLQRTPRCYQAIVKDSRIARISFMRPPMIPKLVARGQYDLGIVGSDVVAEYSTYPQTKGKVTVLTKLNCAGRGEARDFRIVLLAGKDNPAKTIRDIGLGPILSEYPRLTKEALVDAGVMAGIYPSLGTTEANIPHDFPYGVCVASTEETLRANGLKVIHILSVETTVAIGKAGGVSRFSSPKKEDAAISLLGDLTR